jgi:hypothetical protein
MDHNFWVFLVGAALLAWAVSLAFVRHRTRKRLLQTLAQEEVSPEDVDIPLNDLRPEDRQALEIIRRYRRRILIRLWPDTQLSLGLLSEISQALVKEIAEVYYPEEERPELKASLSDLVALYKRVGARLAAWLDTLPLRPLKDMELQTVLQCHELYQKVKQHPGYLFLKRYHLDKAARWAWAAKNFLNPWYWGRQAAYTGSKELLQRLFLAKVTTLVGEEAIQLYGRRRHNSDLFQRYRLALQEMINLAWDDGASPSTWNHMLLFILRAKGLEDQEKLELLHRLAHPRRQKTLRPGTLEKAEREAVRRWLKQWVKSCWTGPSQERRLAQVNSRWED